ncbi:retrovirus-related pol polyprotein from transposon TNT 1-94 [Tanacetum coccineum]|uniref:Retrovirus-related pol polyprotein from transposon TNT 1-94 n=1 Tax=Tanacetum coccineum TaxID=301880 RepID=A0ABQ5B4R5_9ASTR
MNLVTTLSDRIGVLEADLMKTKKTYSSAYTKLILRVKKLERKLFNEEVQEKASTDTELFIQEVTLTEVIQDQEASEKASDEVSTAGAKKDTTAEEVPIVSIAEVDISTAGGTVTYPKKKSKKELEQERLSYAEAIRLEEQMNEEQRAQIARDEEIARQWDEEERKRAMDEAKTTKKIDWNDPSVIIYHTQKMKPKTVAQARRNMIKYLKNQGKYKINDFKGMSYNEIRPIFEKKSPEGMKFAKKMEEDDVVKEPGAKRKKSIPRQSTRKKDRGRCAEIGRAQRFIYIITQEKRFPIAWDQQINQVLSENERLLAQAIDNDIVKTVVNLSLNEGCETVNECQRCLELKTELLNKKDFVDKETYDKLCKSFTTLEKHCITLEADSQLNQENFQLENSVLNQNAPSFTQLFELSELRAQSQAKDTVIVKLKEQIKSLNGNVDDSTVKMDMDEIETLNIELEHRVTKLVAENEHLKQTYKQLYDSIKPKRVQSKEQCDALIKQVNIKSGEISDLNAKLQEQGLVIAALKNELRKLKGKAVDKEAIETHSVDPNVLKDNMEPITPKLLNKRTAHSSYIKHTQEEALVLRDIVEHVKANYPHDSLLESAFRYTKVIQDLLSHISRSCPSINNFGPQIVEVTPRKKDKKVRNPVNPGDPQKPIFHLLLLMNAGCLNRPLSNMGNDQVAKIMGYGDYQIGNVTISRARCYVKSTLCYEVLIATTTRDDNENLGKLQGRPKWRGIEEDNHDIEVVHMGNDPYFGIPILEVTFNPSSSSDRVEASTGSRSATVRKREAWGRGWGCEGDRALGDDRPSGVRAYAEQQRRASAVLTWDEAEAGILDLPAPRAWYDMLSSFLISNDFSKGLVDPTLFIRREGKELLLVQIYVDDIIFAASTPELCDLFAKIIKSKLDDDKEGNAVDPSHYRGMIGTLLYLKGPVDLTYNLLYACVPGIRPPTEKHLMRHVSWSSKGRKALRYHMELNIIVYLFRCLVAQGPLDEIHNFDYGYGFQ